MAHYTREDMASVSRHLFKVLDVAGASEYVRHTRQHKALVGDVLASLTNVIERSDVAIYTFGSMSEGTTTPGMNSDTDIMMCFRIYPVFETSDDVRFDDMNVRYRTEHGDADYTYLIMLSDEETPIGFCKLEFMSAVDTEPIDPDLFFNICMDINGRFVITNSCMVDAMDQDERNGPAATTFKRPGFTDLDYIPSFRCAKWPSVAEEFLTRKRKYGFPSTDMAGDFGSFGIFFVPTGHSETQEKHLQWRLSFSLQERKIMLNLNPTQFKCYILLKMVKEDFVKPVVPGKSLTSYQCKTSIFWSIEQTHPSIWVESNLVACFVKCLHLLKIWIRNGFVPNFFMPPVSIWKGSKQICKMVTCIIDNILKDPIEYLRSLKCDRVGSLLRSSLEPCVADGLGMPDHAEESDNYFREAKRTLHLSVHRLHYSFICETAYHWIGLLQHVSAGDDLDTCITYHRRLIGLLRNTTKMSEMTSQQLNYVQQASEYVLPFLLTSYGSQLASKSLLQPNGDTYEQAMAHLKTGQHSDALSGSIKLAAILYAMEKYEDCLKLLNDKEREIAPDLITIGMCGRKREDFTHTVLINDRLVNKIINNKMTSSEVLRENTCACVIFLPSEMPLIPKELQYELFRSFCSETEFSQDVNFWFDFVAVDSKVLLYYMLYLVHKKLGHRRDRNDAFLFLNIFLEKDFNLCHAETGFNLVGTILRDMGHLESAMSLFKDSWTKRPDHNAAKWQALITCYLYYRTVTEEDFKIEQESLESEEHTEHEVDDVENEAENEENIIYQRCEGV
ncbi:hypothetical protein DPMN_175487 [Dreissena polymorpha]|uniref:Mab-21-like nucleotidyltransferase domain-containing protein n=2 Tax=Dreissena polymorpha TaxID=45954 RepID=A0A9D4E594_DREPO|nr:hypothetical protein DPMN_175487 [Dreissena polymorpha]